MDNISKIMLIFLACILCCCTVFAQENAQVQTASSGGAGEPAPTQRLAPIQSSNTFDLGMPQQSFADPEYVAQQKMVESMTTAYNWIALNSSRFAKGCKEDRDALVSEIAAVINTAQETSSVCSMFASEAENCNPEIFCARFKQGNLPLPSTAISALKKLGYDPETLKIEDITAELITEVCMEQRKGNSAEQTSMLESVKEKIKSQLPDFRQKCEQLKQMQGQTPDIMLPNIDIRPQIVQNYVATSARQGPQGGACAEPHPDCYPLPAPQCKNGTWVCEGVAQQQPIEQQVTQQEKQEPQQPPQEQQPQEQPQEPQPPQEPPAEETPTDEGATGGAAPAKINPITGLVAMGNGYQAVCGNTLCEPDYGEDNSNCPQDCTPNASGTSGGGYVQQPTQTTQVPMPPGFESQSEGYNQPVQGTQSGGYGPQVATHPQMAYVMPSPEQLCEMSDAEIIDAYTKPMTGGMPSEQEMQYQCGVEANRALSDMSRYKMEIARCNADAALDCEAKKQALQSCNEMQSAPEKVAGLVVDNMCRRFGVPASEDTESELYAVATKWYSSDPALANQLGDTADKTAEDKKKLDIISYLFGNGDYADKLSERAAQLRSVRERLVSSGVNDQETLSTLDAQAEEFETESDKFSNFFDLTRLGYLFK